MKPFAVVLFSVLCCACAGNPPAWWNPSGAYSAEEPSASVPRQTAAVGAPAVPNAEAVLPAEQTIDPVLDGYEELNLSPLEMTEEPASLPEERNEETPAYSASSPQEPVSAPVETEEHLPEDGSLPPPSVLE